MAGPSHLDRDRMSTGDRATLKVRRWARRSGFGAIRHVEANRPGLLFWGIAVAICFPLFSYYWFDIDDRTIFSATVGTFILIILLLAVFFGGEKLVVLDGGIIIGSFAPFLKPYFVPLSFIDARTVRTVVCSPRPFTFLCINQGFSYASRTSIWSRRQITFIGRSAGTCRLLMEHPEYAPQVMSNAGLPDLWQFTARTTRRQLRTASAIVAALRDAGIPGSEFSERLIGTPRHLGRTIEDADYLALPEVLRAPQFRREFSR